MEFTNFTTLIKEEIEKRTGENYNVRLNDVMKNNGVVLRGLTVMHEDSNISPTIYLNNYYDAYQSGEASLVNVVNDVLDTYNRNKVDQSVDIKHLLDYDCVKKHIVYKLINTEKNRELLADIPHVEFLDLSIVFQCMVDKDIFENPMFENNVIENDDSGKDIYENGDFKTASILIYNVHMKLWDITLEELYRVARENTQKIKGYEIKNMKDVICDIMLMENSEEIDGSDFMTGIQDNVPMYVLSSKNRIEGAACMLYPELIKDFAEALGSSMYIIPSSVHELLLVPSEGTDESESIKNMIAEINDTQLNAEEILSYSLYFFDKGKGKVIRL